MKKIDETKINLEGLYQHINSLESRLAVEIQINKLYSNFFTARPDFCNWMRDHNKQFKKFKASKFYRKPKNVINE
jgi:hypothetical protein